MKRLQNSTQNKRDVQKAKDNCYQSIDLHTTIQFCRQFFSPQLYKGTKTVRISRIDQHNDMTVFLSRSLFTCVYTLFISVSIANR